MPKVLNTPTGHIVISADTAGVCDIHWEKQAKQSATPTAQEEALATQLEEYFNGTRQTFEAPLNLAGTPFCKKVWQELLNIPYGQTVTYGELAKKINSSPRAVGRAVGTNPCPIVVPCHRVMGANGALTGFSGGDGISTKQKLLDLEQAHAHV